MGKNLFIALLPFMSSAAFTSLSFGMRGGESSVALVTGGKLVVEMEAKPGSTGYDWQPVGEFPKCLTASEPVFIPNTKDGRVLPGASVQKQITFEARAGCAGDIRYEYIRPWEGRLDSTPTVHIHVSVADPDGL